MKELHAVTMKMDKKQKVFYSLFRAQGVDFAMEKILRVFGGSEYVVVFDERSTKVESKNSLKDYL